MRVALLLCPALLATATAVAAPAGRSVGRLNALVDGGLTEGAAGRPGSPLARLWSLPPTRLLPLLAAALLAVALGPPAGMAAAMLLPAAAGVPRRRAARRASDVERLALREALSLFAAELRAGRPAADALGLAAAVASAGSGARLQAAAGAAATGGDVGAALELGAATPLGPVISGLAACWRVCAEAGVGLAAAVERLEQSLQEDDELRRVLATEVAGPRTTAALLAGLPLAGVGLAAALGADPLRVLLHTPAGGACLVLGVGLDVAGVLWTRRLVRGPGE